MRFSGKELADISVRYCADSNAVLLQNHGAVCCGKDAESALSLAHNIEYLAEIQYHAMAIGMPKFISENDMTEVLKKFALYGQ